MPLASSVAPRGLERRGLSPTSPPWRSTGPPVPLLPLPARLSSGSGYPRRQGQPCLRRFRALAGHDPGRVRSIRTRSYSRAGLTPHGHVTEELRAFPLTIARAPLAPFHPMGPSLAVVYSAWAQTTVLPRVASNSLAAALRARGNDASHRPLQTNLHHGHSRASLDFLRSHPGLRLGARPGENPARGGSLSQGTLEQEE
jgi:hypothetical protein